MSTPNTEYRSSTELPEEILESPICKIDDWPTFLKEAALEALSSLAKVISNPSIPFSLKLTPESFNAVMNPSNIKLEDLGGGFARVTIEKKDDVYFISSIELDGGKIENGKVSGGIYDLLESTLRELYTRCNKTCRDRVFSSPSKLLDACKIILRIIIIHLISHELYHNVFGAPKYEDYVLTRFYEDLSGRTDLERARRKLAEIIANECSERTGKNVSVEEVLERIEKIYTEGTIGEDDCILEGLISFHKYVEGEGSLIRLMIVRLVNIFHDLYANQVALYVTLIAMIEEFGPRPSILKLVDAWRAASSKHLIYPDSFLHLLDNSEDLLELTRRIGNISDIDCSMSFILILKKKGEKLKKILENLFKTDIYWFLDHLLLEWLLSQECLEKLLTLGFRIKTDDSKTVVSSEIIKYPSFKEFLKIDHNSSSSQ